MQNDIFPCDAYYKFGFPLFQKWNVSELIEWNTRRQTQNAIAREFKPATVGIFNRAIYTPNWD